MVHLFHLVLSLAPEQTNPQLVFPLVPVRVRVVGAKSGTDPIISRRYKYPILPP